MLSEYNISKLVEGSKSDFIAGGLNNFNILILYTITLVINTVSIWHSVNKHQKS